MTDEQRANAIRAYIAGKKGLKRLIQMASPNIIAPRTESPDGYRLLRSYAQSFRRTADPIFGRNSQIGRVLYPRNDRSRMLYVLGLPQTPKLAEFAVAFQYPLLALARSRLCSSALRRCQSR